MPDRAGQWSFCIEQKKNDKVGWHGKDQHFAGEPYEIGDVNA